MKAVVAFFQGIKLGQARAVLFGTWLFGALAVFLFLAFQSLVAATAWEWLVPAVGPTLALISASAVVSALNRDPAEDQKLARPFVFYAALAWSFVYLAVLVVMIAASTNTRWHGVYMNAATPLAAMQTILAGLLGAFFAAKAT